MRRLTRVILLMLVPITLGAQSSEQLFAPFVSRLRLAINDPQVRITWEAAPGTVGGYLIYRSTTDITAQTLDQTELVGRVDAQTFGYVDVPVERGSYHYAVLAEAENGEPIRFVIPGRNATFRPVEVTQLATDFERAATVRSLSATVADDRTVALEIVADRGGRTLALYRSTVPINAAADLLQATLFREISSETRRVEDFPVPGVEYFYAVADTAQVLAGAIPITPGQNVTVEAVSLPLESPAIASPTEDATRAVPEQATGDRTVPERSTQQASLFEPPAGSVQALPLPFLQLQTRLSTNERLDEPRFLIGDRVPVSRETEDAVDSLVTRLTSAQNSPPGPRLLPADLVPNTIGADYTLQTILNGPFARMAWEEALQQIDNFFSLPLTDELRARAHYYRAQLHYQLGDSRSALLEFLLSRNRHYVATEAWIRHILGNGDR